MKILYLTDNRSDYGMGYYYEDWLAAFKNKFSSVTVFGPGYGTSIDDIPSDIDLVVYGHAFMDVYLGKKFRYFGGKSFKGLDLKKYKAIPSILFSKNEYKLMNERIEYISGLDDCLLVCYCRQTLEQYQSVYKNIIWAPFGVNETRFKDFELPRDIDIGMRGNRHGSYIGQLRSDVANSLAQLNFLRHDIKLSDNGEDFLFGDEYVNWLNRSMFVANTKSAMDIVNPKFAETIACGSIPICPQDYYENILVEGEHYVNYKQVLNLNSHSDFISFYEDKKLEMSSSLTELALSLRYSSMLDIIVTKLQGHYESSFVFDRFK